MSKLLRTTIFATALKLAGCSMPKQQPAETQVLETQVLETQVARVIKSTEEQASAALNDQPESPASEKVSLRYSQYKLNELMDLLDVKKFSQIENASSYIVCIKKLLNEAQKRGIVNFGEDLALDSVLSNDDTKAIIAFQKAFNNLLPAGHRISVDGKIGPETIGALLTVVYDQFKRDNAELTLIIFFVSSHNKKYYKEQREEWAAQDKIDEENRRFFESLDREKVETYTRQILNLTPQRGPIVLPDTMNSAEAGMALWYVWSSTENEQRFNDLIRDSFAISKITTCERLTNVILTEELKRKIKEKIIPYLQGLYRWGDAPDSPTNFYNSLNTQ
ncbi:hypothetical protein CL656_02570 [bacterium]|nr:hypothetical protein [bacterium]|tara:strand:- start:2052 stop:3053 length:1002 start_codon:yes stop_codon:yes gene_type:complete